MADLRQVALKVELENKSKFVKDAEDAAKAAQGMQKAMEDAGKSSKDMAKNVSDGGKEALAAQRKANADLLAERKKLAEEQIKTEQKKQERQQQIIDQGIERQIKSEARKDTAAIASQQRADALLEKRLANQEAGLKKIAAIESKYLSQGEAAATRASAYKANQMSLVENRALTTQARIEQGEQRLALQREKFEDQKARAAERSARRQVSAFESVRGVMETLRDLTIIGFGVDGAAGAISSVVKTADTMTLLESRLKLATKSSEEFNQANETLRKSSVQNGLALTAQIDGYTQLERSTRAMGLGVKDLTFLTESFGKAAIVSGASSESYKSALTQLNQGFASGVIRGQEFNSVAEQAPAVMEALAEGMRGTNKEFDDLEKKGYLGVAALRKMAGEGKLVNSVTIPALMEGLKKTNEQFEQMPVTVERAFEKVKSAYAIWISDTNKANGATSTFAAGLESLANNFGTIVSALTTAGGAIALVFAGRIVAGIVSATKASAAWGAVTGVAAKESVAAASAANLYAQQTWMAARADEAAAKAALMKVQAQQRNAATLLMVAEAQTKYTVAQQASFIAGGKAAQASQNYEKALNATTIASRAAGAASTAFSTVVGALGGPVGVAITALGLLIVYWDDINKSIQEATKSKKYFFSIKEEDLVAGSASDIDKVIKNAKDELAAVEKAKKQLQTQNIPSGFDAYTGGRSVNSESIKAQMEDLRKRESAARSALVKAEAAKEQQFADFRKSEVAGYNEGTGVRNFTGPTPDTKTKTPKTPEQTIGLEAGLSALRNRIELVNSEAEQQKKLLGYIEDTTLSRQHTLELEKLGLEQQVSMGRIEEQLNNKKAVFAKGVREQLQAEYKELVAKAEVNKQSLVSTQNLETINNNLLKIDKERGIIQDNVKDSTKLQYELDVKTAEENTRALSLMEASGDVLGKNAKLKKLGIEFSKQEADFRRDILRLEAEEETALQKLETVKAGIALYGMSDTEAGKQAIRTAQNQYNVAQQNTQERRNQLEVAKNILATDQQLVEIQGDWVAGMKKALAEYEDGVNNLYNTSESLAKGIINNLESIFTQFVLKGKLSFKSLGDYAKQELAKIAAQEVFIKPVTSGLRSALGGGNTSGGNGTDMLGQFASLANSKITQYTGFDIGASLQGVGDKISGFFGMGGGGAAVTPAQMTADLAYGGTGSAAQVASGGVGSVPSASTASSYLGTATAIYTGVDALKEKKYGTAVGTAAGYAIGASFGMGPVGAQIGSALGSLVDKTFGGKGGEKVGGEARSGNISYGDLYTPDQMDNQISGALTDFTKGLAENIKKFGGEATDIGVAFGYDTDPQGSAGNRYKSIISLEGKIVRELIDKQFEGEISEVMASEMKAATLFALKAANIQGDVGEYLKGVDVAGLTAEGIAATFEKMEFVKAFEDVFKQLGDVFPNLENLTLQFKEALVSAAGGMEAFTTNLNVYYENFYTAQERFANSGNTLLKSLNEMGVNSLPKTREEFRKLVEAQDLTTDAGRKTYASLIGLAGGISSFLSSTEAIVNERKSLEERILEAMGNSTELLARKRREELAAVDASNKQLLLAVYAEEDRVAALKLANDEAERAKKLQEDSLNSGLNTLKAAINQEKKLAEDALNAEIKRIEEARDVKIQSLEKEKAAQQTAYQSLEKHLNSVRSALKSVEDQSGITMQQRAGSLESLYQALDVISKGGNLDSVQGFEKALEVVSKPSEQLYSSFEDYTVDQAKAKTLLTSIDGKGTTQLDVAQRQLTALGQMIDQERVNAEALITQLKAVFEQQVLAWDATLKYYETSVNAILGVKDATLSLKDAIANISGAIAAASRPAPAPPTAVTPPAVTTPPSNSGGSNSNNSNSNGTTTSPPVHTGAGAAPTGSKSPYEAVNDIYKSVLNREADAEGLIFYTTQLIGGKALADIKNEIADSPEAKKLDGSHANGLDWVPKDNYKANLHRGEQVLTASQREEYQWMKQQGNTMMAEMAALLRQITLNTGISTKKMEKWDGDGMPEVRTV